MIKMRRWSKGSRTIKELQNLYKFAALLIMDAEKDMADARYEVLDKDGNVEWELTLKKKVPNG